MTTRELIKLIDEKLGNLGNNNSDQSFIWETCDLRYKEDGATWTKYSDVKDNFYICIRCERLEEAVIVKWQNDEREQNVKILESNIKLV